MAYVISEASELPDPIICRKVFHDLCFTLLGVTLSTQAGQLHSNIFKDIFKLSFEMIIVTRRLL